MSAESPLNAIQILGIILSVVSLVTAAVFFWLQTRKSPIYSDSDTSMRVETLTQWFVGKGVSRENAELVMKKMEADLRTPLGELQKQPEKMQKLFELLKELKVQTK